MLTKNRYMNYVSLFLLTSSIAIAQHEAAPEREGFTEITCTIVKVDQQDTPEQATTSHPHIPGPRVRVASGMTTSTNWSGYAAANKLSSPKVNTVEAVYGSWIVPTLKSTPNTSYCAAWVGIDGYNSSTVEQIGTEHDWSNGAQQNYAWFEMYPGGSYSINGFPLHPGDVISASVVYSGNYVFTMKLYNETQRVVITIPTQYTRSTAARRESAEWIIEAPYENGILPLSDFGTFHLMACSATINNVTAPIGNNSWQHIGLEMVTNSGAAKAIPSALMSGNGAFSVTWKHE